MFKKDSPELKILLISMVIVVAISIIAMISLTVNGKVNFSALEYVPVVLGISALVVALFDIFIGLIMFISNKRAQGSGFLITAGILLLISGVSCGGGSLFL